MAVVRAGVYMCPVAIVAGRLMFVPWLPRSLSYMRCGSYSHWWSGVETGIMDPWSRESMYMDGESPCPE